MITGWKKLTKAELKHLSASGIYTDKDFKKTLEYQAQLRLIGMSREPCWECRLIAKKLELEVN